MSNTDLLDYIYQWLTEFEETTGVKPIVYGGDDFMNDIILSDSRFKDYTLWIPRYPKDDSLMNNKKAAVRPKKNNWTFWQMSNKTFAGGVNVDIDKFNGSYKEFKLKYE